jgi:hypothetical protein
MNYFMICERSMIRLNIPNEGNEKW